MIPIQYHDQEVVEAVHPHHRPILTLSLMASLARLLLMMLYQTLLVMLQLYYCHCYYCLWMIMMWSHEERVPQAFVASLVPNNNDKVLILDHIESLHRQKMQSFTSGSSRFFGCESSLMATRTTGRDDAYE
jgi:ABC-type bacteriocin/lantibiotic exporter with double-glycine peptidase domain